MSHSNQPRLLLFLAPLVPLLGALLLTGGLGRGATEEELALPAVPNALRAAMMAGEQEQARGLLDELIKRRSDEADFWAYLRGVSYLQEDALAEAVTAFEEQEESYPQSRWSSKARFGRGEALYRLRRFEEAEEIFEAGARRLRAPERQAELASIYLRLADVWSGSLAEAKPGQTLDYERAHSLYARVLELGAPLELQERARFSMGVCRQAQERWAEAVADLEAYLAVFDPLFQKDQRSSASPGTLTRVLEVRARLGECRLRVGNPLGARHLFEDNAHALRQAAEGRGAWAELARGLSAEQSTSLRTAQGAALYGVARSYVQQGDATRILAIGALRRFVEEFPRHEKSARAAFEIATLLNAGGRSESALEAFDRFLERPILTDSAGGELPVTLMEEEARLRRSALYRKAAILSAQGRHAAAIEQWNEYVRRYPTGEDWAAAQQGIVDAHYAIGTAHREAGDFAAARTAWTDYLQRYPLQPNAPATLLAIGELFRSEADSLEEDAEDSVENGAARKLREQAIQQWDEVVAKYSGSDVASYALYNKARLQELKLGQPEEALATYRACDFGPMSNQASLRRSAMLSQTLGVVTERTWRSNETPAIQVQVRNLEELEVRLYRLDLEAYFQKHLTHQRVEDLDLDLIAADQSWKVAVEGYQRFTPLEQAVELPVDGPGVWAVAVLAGEQRATTLVVRSDVDVVVKSSRREVFVFAQDRLREAPAGDVQVLVAIPGAATETFHELMTNEDGVARLALEDLAHAGEIRVLALREGHYASDGLALAGLTLSAGLQPRGFVYTERPAYRPGHRVHWRAIVRDTAGGRYTYRPGQTFAVTLTDSQGRTLRRSEVKASEFGTLSGDFALAAAAPSGTYSLACRAPNGPSFNGSFQVEEYKLQRVELSLETERSIYYRGDEVAVTARAAYYYGEPVVDSPLRYLLPDGTTGETRTDAEGIARFAFPTRNIFVEGTLEFQATLLEEGVSARGRVALASRGFATRLTLGRDVVLAGDDVLVSLATSDPLGEPVGRELTVTLLRRESGRRGWSEIEVGEDVVTTDPETGEAQLLMTLTDGGQYVVRAEGTDRFGNPILAEGFVFASGEEDEQSLRLFAHSASLDVGEDVRVNLHSRLSGGLCLVTFEAEEVVSYRVVTLNRGENALRFEVDHDLFPNFHLSAVSMGVGKLHATGRDFTVRRRLNVELLPERERYAPGDEVNVALRVTDQLGRPVRAELSLAVVDDALFELYPSNVPPLLAFFNEGTRRAAALHTASSCSFRYQGVTRGIDAAVLQEEQRREAETAWKERSKEVLSELAGVTIDKSVSADSPSRRAKLGYLGQDVDEQVNSVIGVGGGAGGVFGSRRGGRKRPGSGMEADPARRLAETAFWSPAVVTDEEGRANVRLELPGQSTRWRLVARGASPESLFGEAEATLLSASEVFVELRTPGLLTEGDRPRFTARVHNTTGRSGEGSLSLTIKSGTEVQSFPVALRLGAERVSEYVFDLSSAVPAVSAVELEATLEVRLGDETFTDAVATSVSVRPFGLEESVAKSGRLTDRATLNLELPAGAAYTERMLEVYVGPGLGRWLIDTALEREAISRRIAGGRRQLVLGDTEADRLLGVCGVLELLGEAGRGSQPEYAALREAAADLVAQVVARQQPEGGWSWTAKEGRARVEATVGSLVSLAAARAAGLEVPPQVLSAGASYLEREARGLGQQANERKAMVQYALAKLGRGDFGSANRLYRERNRLGTAALAYTTLALVEMKRAPMAAEVARILERQAQPGESAPGEFGCRWNATQNIAWNRSALETNALVLSALQAALPDAASIARGVEELLQSRPWPRMRGRGRAVAAVSYYESELRPRSDQMMVRVEAGGQVHVLDLSPNGSEKNGSFLRIPLPDSAGEADAKGDAVRVALTLEGRGQPDYTALLRGFTRKIEPRRDPRFRVLSATYRTAPAVFAGKEYPGGFQTVANERERWVNEVDHLPLGGLTNAVVYFRRESARSASAEAYDYLVLEVPLPAGTSVLSGSVRGGFESFRVEDGSLIAYYGPELRDSSLNYTLVGGTPGQYRVLPPILASAYEPGRVAIGSVEQLTVLKRGEESPDEYRSTPDELFGIGRAAYQAGDQKLAQASLGALFEGFGDLLRPEPLREAAEMMFFLAVDRDASSDIVRYFEILKERNPELFVPVEKIMAVGSAYREIGEFERAALIFRAVTEETFGKDLKVAGALEELGEFREALAILEQLWLEFPDLPVVVATNLAVSDKLLAKAPEAHLDPKLRATGWDRARLSLEGILLLQRFLTIYAQDPLAPEAGLNLVSARLELEDYGTASKLAGEMAELYAEPTFADAFLYSQAVADWYSGEEESALALLQRIAHARYTDATGETHPSENRDLAFYILGQIHHARREAKEATEYYEKVEDLFADAREALLSFRAKSIAIDELLEVAPGSVARLELRHRNLEAAEILVYAVDLMTLYLREKNLSAITEVNLAGIEPKLRRTVPLTTTDALREAKSEIELDLKEPGAYLVICRGEELFTSGLVLVSDLELEVSEDPASGRMRIQAMEREGGRYLRDVDVRVIGSSSDTFHSGDTDPRGLFVADAVQGRPTVIARLGTNHYAFHRGGRALGQVDPVEKARDGLNGREPADGPVYLDNVFRLNKDNRLDRQQAYQNEVDQVRRGVQVLRVTQ